jgi:hypothetical protein
LNATNASIGAIVLLTVFVDLWAILSIIPRPASAFDAAGTSKTLWLVLIIGGIVVFNLGFFVSLWYLFIVDPKVRRMQRLGPGIGFPGGTSSNFPT